MPSFFLLEGIVSVLTLSVIFLFGFSQLLHYQKELKKLQQQVTCYKLLEEVTWKHFKGEKVETGYREGETFYVEEKEKSVAVFFKDTKASFQEIP